jgi:hypothetical protein
VGPAGGRLAVAPPRFTFAPYLQDVSEQGVVIVWVTDVPTTGVVRVFDATTGSSQASESDALGFEPDRAPQAVFMSPPGTHHRVRLSGLRPGTRYRYVVAVRRQGA